MNQIYQKNRKLFLIKFLTRGNFFLNLRAVIFFLIKWFCTRYLIKFLPNYFLGYRRIGVIPVIKWDKYTPFIYCPKIYVLKLSNGSLSSYDLFDPHDAETFFFKNRFSFCVAALILDDEVLESSSFEKVNHYLTLNHTCNPSNPRDETYSVCERLVNFSFLISSTSNNNLQINNLIYSNFYIESTKLILNNLENFNLKRVNNHILNNARALVVSGTIIGSNEIIEYGLYIFHFYIPILFREGGSLREGSTHYQLIVMNWLLDIIKYSSFSELSQKSKEYLDGLIQLSMNAKWLTNFLVQNIIDHHPLFIGDISPDLDPLITAYRLTSLYPDYFLDSSINNNSFQKLDDWLIFSNENNQIISRISKDGYPPVWPTHSHSDLTHIIWIYYGFPILIDAGRLSYKKDRLNLSQVSAYGHNVALINSVGPTAESLVYGGYWCPSPYSSVIANCIIESDICCEILHNGYCGIDNLEQHSRKINIHSNGIAVYDSFSGHSYVDVNFLWNFPSGFKLVDIANCKYLLYSENIKLEVTIDLGENDSNNVFLDFIPFQYSTQYSASNEGSTLSLKIFHVKLPSNFHTNFRVISCAE